MNDLSKFRSDQVKEWSPDVWDGLLAAVAGRLAPLEEQLGIERRLTDQVVARGLQIIEEKISPSIGLAASKVAEVEAKRLIAIAAAANIVALLEQYQNNAITADAVTQTVARRFVTAETITEIVNAARTNAALTGDVTVPDRPAADSTSHAASTKFVTDAIDALLGASSGQLQTIQDLADALGNDPDFAATVTAQIAAATAELGGRLAATVGSATAVTNLNNTKSTGWFFAASSAANVPTAANFLVEVIALDANNVVQRAISYASTEAWFQRVLKAGVWSAWAQVTYNAGMVWHAQNFDPSSKVSKAGDTMAALTIESAQPSLALKDTTDNSVRRVYSDGGLTGFLGADGQWTFRVDDNGAAWFEQFGDLNSRIEARAAAHAASQAASAAAGRVSGVRFTSVMDHDCGTVYQGAASIRLENAGWVVTSVGFHDGSGGAYGVWMRRRALQTTWDGANYYTVGFT